MKTDSRSYRNAIAAMCLLTAPVQAAHASGPTDDKAGSAYLQCDGKPNNVTSGETAARLLGAVTLLGLFAKPPEAPDASKRKFGAEGVTVCDSLLVGDKKEGNPSRRVDLLLGRAIHQIEAKNYDAAIADARMARGEADAAGLLKDSYYARSAGRAFDLIEAAALYRLNKPVEARAAGLRGTAAIRRSALALFSVPDYLFDDPAMSDAEADYIGWRTHSAALTGGGQADRLEEWGRFAEAAKVRNAMVDLDRVIAPDLIDSEWLARAAVSHMLAGNTEAGAARAAEARANIDKRRIAGKPEKDAAEIVEVLDLYAILELASKGDAAGARRLFAARSQWVAASFGTVVETTRRLRNGARPDEMIGGLSRDPGQLWKEHLDSRRAEVLAKDSDNKSLFWLLPSMEGARSYRALAKQVWRTDKSKLIIKLDHPEKAPLKMERMFLYGATPTVALDAFSLHAALLAKQRGQQGFVIMPLFSGGYMTAGFLTGNRGDAGMPEAVFNDADQVIAELKPLLPDPVTLKTIEAAESKR